jgi:hypothetical protein
MPAALERRQEDNGLINILFDRGTLFHLYVGRWTGNKKANERDLLLDDALDKDVFYLGHKKLLPPDAQKQLATVERNARKFLYDRSMEFVFANARYVTYQALPEILARLPSFKAEWDEAVNFLCENYPRFKEEQLKRLEDQTKSLADSALEKVPVALRPAKREQLKAWEEERNLLNRSLYPDVAVLRSKMTFEYRMFKVSPIDGLENLHGLDRNTLLEEQERLVADTRKFVQEASTAMHQALGEAAARAREVLNENGKLNARNLRPLFEAFETFSAVNFSGKSEFANIIDSVRSRYLVKAGDGEMDLKMTAERMNDNAQEIRSVLAQMADLTVETTATQAGIRMVRQGEFGRLIDLS